MRLRNFLVSVLLIIGAQQALGFDYTVSGDLTFFRGYRVLRGQNASDYLTVDDTVGVVGLDAKLEQSDFTLDLKLRLLGASSPGLELDPIDPAYLNLRSPKRYLQWDGYSGHHEKNQTFTDFEKAFLLYQKEKFEFSIGRRAIGIGALKYLPIWNRFVPSVAQIGGPALIYNSDNIQASYQFNKFALSAYHVASISSSDEMSFVVGTWYLDWIELHGLAGTWWNRATAGLAFVKDLEGLTIRGEGLVFQGDSSSGKTGIQTGLGAEYAFNAKWSFVLEGLYSNVGASKTDDYLAVPRDPFEILNADSYLFGVLEYLPFDFWKVSAGALVNLMDSSSFAIADIKYSWSNNLDITFQLKQPVGSNGQEFGSDFFRIDDDVNFGASQQTALQINYYF